MRQVAKATNMPHTLTFALVLKGTLPRSGPVTHTHTICFYRIELRGPGFNFGLGQFFFFLFPRIIIFYE